MSERLIRVLIADDHPVVRQGLRLTIEADPALSVVAEADSGGAALRLVETHAPDVAVLDIAMPQLDGFAVARAVRDRRLPTAVVFLTIHRDAEYVDQAFAAGAHGYVLKDSAMTDIVTSIKAAAAGEHYTSPAMTSHLVERRRRPRLPANVQALTTLTAAERRVLALIADYKTSREIAGTLGVSARTVETHRANATAKLGISGRHALMKFVVEHRRRL